VFVVDASIVLAWCLDDETSELADTVIERLLTEGGVAPAHWPVEVANGLRAAERRGRIDEPALHRLRPRLTQLPVDIAPVELSTALAVIESSRTHDLSVYDAAYLDLAEFRALGLATVDARLAEACKVAGIALITA
jgi:predicted nucleic acid-binding protein